MGIRIAALLTCHNRRNITVSCLAALRAQKIMLVSSAEDFQTPPSLEETGGLKTEDKKRGASTVKENGNQSLEEGVLDQRLAGRQSTMGTPHFFDSPTAPERFPIETFLVDDASTDGTAEAVREIWPGANILRGSGDLYWCRGMCRAWDEAAATDPDYYLLLNDDTVLYPGALSELLKLCPSPDRDIIAVAAIEDPATHEIIYGAQHTFIQPVFTPNGEKQKCNAFNANCVLIPRRVFQLVGTLDPAFHHSMGDADYGFRAFRGGINIIQSSNALGWCARNSVGGTWRDASLPIFRRFILSQRPNGLPWREWLLYTRRHLGWRWPRYFISPYVRILLGK